MIKRIVSLTAVVAALAVSAAYTMAGEPQSFDRAAFAEAKSEGKTVLVDFHAGWCPVCKKQDAAIPGVLKENRFQDVVVFKADYDTEKELKKELKVTQQSTLIVFKGEKEAGREQGITTAADIGKLLAKGL